MNRLVHMPQTKQRHINSPNLLQHGSELLNSGRFGVQIVLLLEDQPEGHDALLVKAFRSREGLDHLAPPRGPAPARTPCPRGKCVGAAAAVVIVAPDPACPFPPRCR